jgi:hypothetical protein
LTKEQKIAQDVVVWLHQQMFPKTLEAGLEVLLQQKILKYILEYKEELLKSEKNKLNWD